MDINNHYHGEWTSIAEDGLTWLEEWDVASGRIPLVGWGCYDSNKIISGSEDDVIRKTAQQMKAFGHEFFMRYCWEMDGSRKQGTVKGPKQFNEAWRHMHRIFQQEGATNVIWTWTANAAGFKDKRKYSNNEPPGPHFYPGDEYVDWIAADGYNWGVSKRNQGDRWRQVLEIFDEFMVFARSRPKPIMIGEYGAQEQREDPTAKPEWMRHAHDTLMNKPKTADCRHCGAFSDVAAIVYFDVDYGSHGDWRIMSSDPTLQAFKEASDDPWFHQMDTVSWAPSVNRSNPNEASQYGPKRKSDGPSRSTPPPEESSAPPEPDSPDQAERAADPAPADQSTPPADQSTPPADQSTPPADQSTPPADQSTPPADQSTPPADQSTPPPERSSSAPERSSSAPEQSRSDPKQSSSDPKQSSSDPKQSSSDPKQSSSDPKQSSSDPKQSRSDSKRSTRPDDGARSRRDKSNP